jgi:hypothetical protein
VDCEARSSQCRNLREVPETQATCIFGWTLDRQMAYVDTAHKGEDLVRVGLPVNNANSTS